METVQQQIKEAIRLLFRSSEEEINAFYRKPIYVLQEEEGSFLQLFTFKFQKKIKDEITEILKANQIPYINTLWQNATESISSLTLYYIDWPSEKQTDDFSDTDNTKEIILSQVKSKAGKLSQKIKPNLIKQKEKRQREIESYEKIRSTKNHNISIVKNWYDTLEANIINILNERSGEKQ